MCALHLTHFNAPKEGVAKIIIFTHPHIPIFKILNYATMENSDYLRPDNPVSVTILGPDNTRLYQATSTGYRSIEAAINAAVGSAALDVNPEDCVFEVANQATGVSHRYRINAHGNLKLIV